MNKVLEDSLLRKNKQVYKSALNAVERVMGRDFTSSREFRAIRNMILTVGNEVERSIKTELDQYAIVVKDGPEPAAISASEYILSLVPELKFGIDVREHGEVPFIKLKARQENDNFDLVREILGRGIIARANNYQVFEVRGVSDCLEVLPILTQIMARFGHSQEFGGWVQKVYSLYQDTGD
jgi:hypothetical protein